MRRGCLAATPHDMLQQLPHSRAARHIAWDFLRIVMISLSRDIYIEGKKRKQGDGRRRNFWLCQYGRWVCVPLMQAGMRSVFRRSFERGISKL